MNCHFIVLVLPNCGDPGRPSNVSTNHWEGQYVRRYFCQPGYIAHLGRSRAASAYGIIWGDAKAECHSLDCSGDSKVLTELQIAIRSKLLF